MNGEDNHTDRATVQNSISLKLRRTNTRMIHTSNRVMKTTILTTENERQVTDYTGECYNQGLTCIKGY